MRLTDTQIFYLTFAGTICFACLCGAMTLCFAVWVKFGGII